MGLGTQGRAINIRIVSGCTLEDLTLNLTGRTRVGLALIRRADQVTDGSDTGDGVVGFLTLVGTIDGVTDGHHVGQTDWVVTLPTAFGMTPGH